MNKKELIFRLSQLQKAFYRKEKKEICQLAISENNFLKYSDILFKDTEEITINNKHYKKTKYKTTSGQPIYTIDGKVGFCLEKIYL